MEKRVFNKVAFEVSINFKLKIYEIIKIPTYSYKYNHHIHVTKCDKLLFFQKLAFKYTINLTLYKTYITNSSISYLITKLYILHSTYLQLKK